MQTDTRRSVAADLLTASRPLSWVNTAFPFAAAYLLTTREVDLALVVGTLFFLVPYNLAMYGINDVFDYASDAANPAQGRRRGRAARAEPAPPHDHRRDRAVPCRSWSCSSRSAARRRGSCSRSASSRSSRTRRPGCASRRCPFLDSLTSSMHFVSPAVYGLVLAGAAFTPQLLALLAAFLVWGVASHAFGAVQDVVPDREGGIASIATVLGARSHGAVRDRHVARRRRADARHGVARPARGGARGAVRRHRVRRSRASPTPTSARANAGWQRFLGINYAVGFLVTMLLIWYASLTA